MKIKQKNPAGYTLSANNKNFIPTRKRKAAITIRNLSCGMRSTIFFAAPAPMNETGINNKNPKKNCRSKVTLFRRYAAIRAESINSAIAPDVEIYTAFGKSKAERKTPRTAPPTPKIPAKNPDKPPPPNAVIGFFGILNFGLKKRKMT